MRSYQASFFNLNMKEKFMAENYNKSNQEVALDLFKHILDCKHSSGTSKRNMLEEIAIQQWPMEGRTKWLLDLFAECLTAVNSERKIAK